MLTGLYLPGTSPVHRAPAGAKLLALVIGSTLAVTWRSVATAAVGALLVGCGYGVARIGPRVALGQIAPLRWVLPALGLLHAWSSGWVPALVLVALLAEVVLAASLVTLTTTTSSLVDALVAVLRPLRGLGVDPDRVALALSLAIRSIPVLAGMTQEVRQAQRARGCERSVRAFIAPVTIRTMRYADRVGEALSARGLDDG